jgi:hypothetical protein
MTSAGWLPLAPDPPLEPEELGLEVLEEQAARAVARSAAAVAASALLLRSLSIVNFDPFLSGTAISRRSVVHLS